MPTSVSLRSSVDVTFIEAVSTPESVPSTQFATQARVPPGVSATPVGSEPTATEPAAIGVLLSPVIFTSFCSLRRTTYAESLSPAITTCQGSAPTASSATLMSFAGVPSSGNSVLNTLTEPESRLTAMTTLSSAAMAMPEPRLGPGAMVSGPVGPPSSPPSMSPVGGGVTAGAASSPPPQPVSFRSMTAVAMTAAAAGKPVR